MYTNNYINNFLLDHLKDTSRDIGEWWNELPHLFFYIYKRMNELPHLEQMFAQIIGIECMDSIDRTHRAMSISITV